MLTSTTTMGLVVDNHIGAGSSFVSGKNATGSMCSVDPSRQANTSTPTVEDPVNISESQRTDALRCPGDTCRVGDSSEYSGRGMFISTETRA